MNKLGINIKTVREEKGFSRRELAEKANITASALANYELGYRIPNDIILDNISQALEVDINYLLGRTKLKDFEGSQLKKFERVIDSILKSSNQDIVKISTDILESLFFILFNPICNDRIGTLKILYKYIEVIRDIYSSVESENYFFEHDKESITPDDMLYKIMMHANDKFKDITNEYYNYAISSEIIMNEILNSKATKYENEPLHRIKNIYGDDSSYIAYPLDIDDFNDDELKDLHNYIKFIRFNRNNKS